jgi:hypothetical protein
LWWQNSKTLPEISLLSASGWNLKASNLAL